MLITEDLSLDQIRKKYGKAFPGTSPHHLVPRSRNGSGSQFNLFPYKRDAHSAYHHIFYNLKIDEVWNNLSQIHNSIFSSGNIYIYQWWIAPCSLDRAEDKERQEFEKQKQKRINKLLPASDFKKKWIKCFGNDSLDHARVYLKYMMLFMVFGVNMISPDQLFDNGNLAEFFETSSSKGYRLWAFEICFGKNYPKVQTIKAKIRKIIKKATHSSP